MRYLNKIIFINSAHIPYAEIKLDGNAHFAGTQGTGKSTVQRAILFFYNADKMKLGIPKEKKPFDEYYFEYPNSYIIYEVVRDDNPYSIVAFMNRGRICYRFIDSAYKKEMFIDENGQAYNDLNHIREHLPQGASMSKIIDTFEEYRDIIFGNRNVRPEFRKYGITQSNNYQNIPRTIQNVFLNSKLDAEFIKETIINSMTDNAPDININVYRNQIAKFKVEYEDVMIWEKKNNKTQQIEVKVIAEDVIKQYLAQLQVERTIESLSAKLRYAIQRDTNAVPALEEQLSRQLEELQRIIRLISEEDKKYNDERDKIVGNIKHLIETLKNIDRKRKDYEEKGIHDIIKRVEAEKAVQNDLAQEQAIFDTLTKEYKNITEKYDALTAQLNNELEKFETLQEQRKIEKKEAALKQEAKVREEIQIKVNNIYNDFLTQDSAKAKQIESLNIEKKEQEIKKERTKTEHIYQTEIDTQKKEIDRLEKLEISLRNEEATIKLKKQNLDKEWENAEATAKKDIDNEKEKLQNAKEPIQQEINKLQAMLDNTDGSLISWMEQNIHGWENNIGKVANENILYNRDLNPQQNDKSSKSFYGIDIDLDKAEKLYRTPADIKKEINEKKKIIHDVEQNTRKRIEEINSIRDEKVKEFASRQKALHEEDNNNRAALLVLPNEKKAANAKLIEYQKKEDEHREQKLKEIEEKIIQIASNLARIETERETLLRTRDKRLKDIEKEKDSKISAINRELQQACVEIEEATKSKRQETKEREKEYIAQRDKELSGNGADMSKIKQVEEKIQTLKNELATIESLKPVYFGYKKDKEELFDNEQSFKDQKKAWEEKKADLENRHNNTHSKHLRQREEAQTAVDESKKKLDKIKEGLSDADKYIDSDTSCPLTLKEGTETIANEDACIQLLNDLRSTVFSKSEKMNNLKKKVNDFKGHFSPNNIFNFKTDISTDEEYMEFARNLSDFMDKNLLDQYKQRLSDNYADILQRLSKEVSDLMRHSSDIEKTILDINRDFREKNFAGVIKDISLRKVESSDKLMQLLVSINEFCQENADNMGEANLFSDEATRTEVAAKTVKMLFALQEIINQNRALETVSLRDTFRLQFRIVENDNDTGWIEKISNVGSDGTDILVKAMVNIMLLNVFKKKMSRHYDDFRLHCMMDEIGKLHPTNVKGILDFANKRNIYLINSSPVSYSVSEYRYNYLLMKDGKSNTMVKMLITTR